VGEVTSFDEHNVNVFKVKLRAEELPTLDNLIKRKPHVYKSNLMCSMCLLSKETYLHLWECTHITNVRKDIVLNCQRYLEELIISHQRNDPPDLNEVKEKVKNCEVWDLHNCYNLSLLAKGFIHESLVALLISLNIVDKDRINILNNLVNKIVLDFKILIWEYRNIKQLEMEESKGISIRLKKSVNNSKLSSVKIEKVTRSRWAFWNSLVCEWGGHWSNV
jgi:hypothetical protein